MKCEKCGKDHDGSFGSGRFCSRQCSNSRAFSEETCEKKRQKAKEYWETIEDRNGRTRNLSPKSYKKMVDALARGRKKSAEISTERSNQRIAAYTQAGAVGSLKAWKIGIATYRKHVLRIKGCVCAVCGLEEEWQGRPLSLHLDHINGDAQDNRLENLQVLCPNCHSQKDAAVEWFCPQCGQTLHLSATQAKKRKYCSGTCRNLATNIHKNGSVSKAEQYLRRMIEEAGYSVVANDRVVLDGLEIDMWIPEKNVGIEYNGIYHLQPIHGDKLLKQMQQRDATKQQRAREKGIRLLVVEDIYSTPKVLETIGKKLLLQIEE